MRAKTTACVSVGLLTAVLSFACGGEGPSSPTTPSSAPAAVGLTGTVSSSTGTRISGATVTVLDGNNSGRSATTDSSGTYRFDNMQRANGNFMARAGGFLEDRRGIYVDGSAALSFTLAPDPTWAGGTWRGTFRSTSCSGDGVFSSFCRTNPTVADSLELVLTQNGSAVTGTINGGGNIAVASGTNQNGQLSIGGSAPPSGGITIVYENWAAAVSGQSMTGTFQVRFATSSGSVRYVVSLSGVSRISSTSVRSLSEPGAARGQLADLVRQAEIALRDVR